jgi:DNA-binding transcriptional MerR regulator
MNERTLTLSRERFAFKIGEVARLSHLPVKTIRYYEEIGLLAPTVDRSHSGYRLFNERVLQRLEFIKRSQTLGLSLQEIQSLLQLHDRGELPCPEAKQHLQQKLQAISAQIDALKALQTELQAILNRWQEQPVRRETTICPNIQDGSRESEVGSRE